MALFPRMAWGPTRHEFGPFVNLFNDTFNELQKISDTASRSFSPKFDVKEAKDSYILEGDLPGIDQKDIHIDFLDDQTLTIKGRTEHYKEEGEPPAKPTEAEEVQNGTPAAASEGAANKPAESKKEVSTTGSTTTAVAKHEPQQQHTYWVSERSVGEFARSFTFPNRVDQDNIKASLKNGVLSVVVPKLQKRPASKRITIE